MFAAPSSARLVGSTDKGGKLVAPTPLGADVQKVLFQTHASSTNTAEDDFTTGCLHVTKAIVAESDGSKKKTASQLALICSGLQLAPDVEICERYRSTLLGHLHRDASWNLESMDFGLFCKGMEKVVAAHQEELAKDAAEAKSK